MCAAVVDARERVYYNLCQHAHGGCGCAWACFYINCASMRAAVGDVRGCVCVCVLPLVLACVQRLWTRVGVFIINCASMCAAAVDAREREYYHLCQHACSGCGRA